MAQQQQSSISEVLKIDSTLTTRLRLACYTHVGRIVQKIKEVSTVNKVLNTKGQHLGYIDKHSKNNNA